MTSTSPVDRSIQVDEVGIETGFYAGYQLKTAYQPIYAVRGDRLELGAVEALVRPFRDGAPASPAELFATVPREDRLHVESLCRALHMRNHRNMDVGGLELFFNYGSHAHGDCEAAVGQIEHMLTRLGELGLDPGLLVCEITELEAFDRQSLVRLAAEMRRAGIRLGIDDFGAGHSTIERVKTIDPEFVKIDGAWFRRIAGAPPAAQCLARLTESLKAGGAQVLVEGIETREQLSVAVDIGADFVQGFLLARPQLVGTVMNPQPIDLPQRYREHENVVRLYG